MTIAWTIIAGTVRDVDTIWLKVSCAKDATIFTTRQAPVRMDGLKPGDRLRVSELAFQYDTLPRPPTACSVALLLEEPAFEKRRTEVARTCWTPAGTASGACLGWPKPVVPSAPAAFSDVELSATSARAGNPRGNIRISATATFGTSEGPLDYVYDGPERGLKAHVRYDTGTEWRTVDGPRSPIEYASGWVDGVQPGESRVLTIDLPADVTVMPRAVELTLSWSARHATTELATYCFTHGVPRKGRCRG